MLASQLDDLDVRRERAQIARIAGQDRVTACGVLYSDPACEQGNLAVIRPSFLLK